MCRCTLIVVYCSLLQPVNVPALMQWGVLIVAWCHCGREPLGVGDAQHTRARLGAAVWSCWLLIAWCGVCSCDVHPLVRLCMHIQDLSPSTLIWPSVPCCLTLTTVCPLLLARCSLSPLSSCLRTHRCCVAMPRACFGVAATLHCTMLSKQDSERTQLAC